MAKETANQDFNINKERKTRSDLLTRQFAQSRNRLGVQQRNLEDNLNQDVARFGAMNRLDPGSGALLKIKEKGRQGLAEQIGAAEAGLGEAEAGARLAVESELGAERLAREDLKFRKDSFADQMNFQWAEFDQNQRTLFVNTAIALRDAGLRDAKDWESLLGDSGILTQLFDRGGKVPGSSVERFQAPGIRRGAFDKYSSPKDFGFQAPGTESRQPKPRGPQRYNDFGQPISEETYQAIRRSRGLK